MTSLALTFNDVTFNPVNQNDGQIWFTSSQIAEALEYKNSRSITHLFNSNQDEFDDWMTKVVKVKTVINPNGVIDSNTTLKTKGLSNKMRIFSLRGCHLLGMFARTAKAKEFRKWVLNILAKEVGQPVVKPIIDENQLSTTDDRKPLVKAVNMLVDETGAIYSNVWKIIHQQFNVDSVDYLTKAQVPQAVKYVHDLYLLAIQNANHVSKSQGLDTATKNHIAVLVSHTFSVVKWYERVKAPISMLNNELYSTSVEHINVAYHYARQLNQALNLNVNEKHLLAR